MEFELPTRPCPAPVHLGFADAMDQEVPLGSSAHFKHRLSPSSPRGAQKEQKQPLQHRIRCEI